MVKKVMLTLVAVSLVLVVVVKFELFSDKSTGDILKGKKAVKQELKAEGSSDVQQLSVNGNGNAVAPNGTAIVAENVKVDVNQNLDRHLNAKMKKDFLGFVDKSREVDITSIWGDSEAFQLAEEVKVFLIAEGYKVQGVNRTMFKNLKKGLIYNPDINRIIIGKKES